MKSFAEFFVGAGKGELIAPAEARIPAPATTLGERLCGVAASGKASVRMTVCFFHCFCLFS
jgi:hypothetical protein